ncbi:8488_t:CDS:2 [Paraglomus brasilianum]|uniref:8488_t:CDS:1 n=1 Tax=Paraglomus brasilianum TaxID=144538 RepID=A0A9N9GHV0_9GLOM|nr:8488_t:CDS:2 [Paraglomus brasilianum]
MSSNSTLTVKALDFGDGNQFIPLIIIGGVAVGSMILHVILVLILKRIVSKSESRFDREVVSRCSKPTFFMFPLVAILICLALVTNVDESILDPIRHTLVILLLLLSAWTAINFVKALSVTVSNDNDFMNSTKNPNARKLHTQLVIMTRIAYGLIIVICAASVILTFPSAWQFGATVLASASVSALFIGLAAKPSLEIALTQPLLLDDYVSIDGQYGIVEEIQSQYLVLRTAKDSRIIIPLTRVIDQPFENYTRGGDTIGITFQLCVGYGIPLADLRNKFNALTAASEYWDNRECSLEIDDAKESCLLLQATMTASNVKMAEKLKNEIREKLIEYILTTYPEYLSGAKIGEPKIVPKMSEPVLPIKKG